jgi:hypothetical protein
MSVFIGNKIRRAMNIRSLSLVGLMILPLVFSSAFAHQSDSVGDYRIEIDWKNMPPVSGESNAIIVYISEMNKSLEAADQAFDPSKGITGLKKTLKIELVVKEQKITLPLQPDPDIPGKYESVITPTFSGYSQLNFIGKINDTVVSLGLHPVKVEDQSILQFPAVDSTEVHIDDFNREIDDLRGDIRELQNQIKEDSSNDSSMISYAAIALGIAGIALGITALARKK